MTNLVFAQAGEPVTTPDGTIICYVKNDLIRHTVPKSEDFHKFAEGEEPWKSGMPFDQRCLRETALGGWQICINGEWRP